jgi:hypothetical protein
LRPDRALDPDPAALLLDEPSARRLLLAQALEEGDPEGRLVGRVEREQADRESLAIAGDPARGEALDERRYLLERAARLVGLLRHRQPRLAALEDAPAWRAWAAWLLPLAALAAGALIDRIDNPRQVNLLSPPLLAFLFWNLAVYAGLAAMALWPRAANGRGRSWSWPARWGGPPRSGGVRADVAFRFQRAWWQGAGALEGQRWRRILHASAAAWAVGVALSIVVGGLVREYRVGWESTLLDLPQVHAFLRALFAPVVALLPVEPFSQAELARLHFGSGAPVAREEARRWVFLYVGLLAVLVVLPRALLAAWAAWRVRALGRRVPVDLGSAYFTEVLGKVKPVRALLALVAPEAGAHPLATTLRQMAEGPPPRVPHERWLLLRTDRGDRLEAVAWRPPATVAAEAAPSPTPWWARWRRPSAADAEPAARADLVVLAGDAVEGCPPAVLAAGRPLLFVATSGSEAAHAAALRRLERTAEVLPASALPTWREDERLFAALRRLLPAWQAPGLERLREAWRAQAGKRLEAAMRLLAEELVLAARDAEELSAAPVGVRQLVVRGERESALQARRAAEAALIARAQLRRADTDTRLLALHALDGVLPDAQAHVLPERFRVAQQLHEPQAGLAGAAGGAAMGAAVDLMTGGLTLGAASALGALIGGGAALVGAAWKNRSAESGVSLVALGDEMLQALVQGALLRYLLAAHEGRAGAQAPQAWTSHVEDAVGRERDALHALWQRARSESGGADVTAALAQRLEAMALGLLERLNGPAQSP